jgi:hypothetical protein
LLSRGRRGKLSRSCGGGPCSCGVAALLLALDLLLARELHALLLPIVPHALLGVDGRLGAHVGRALPAERLVHVRLELQFGVVCLGEAARHTQPSL